MKQKFTSAKTDLKQIPAIFKLLLKGLERPEHFFAYNRECLDYGGGASDKLTNEFAKMGVRNLVLDPYNRSEDHNKLVRQLLTTKPADFAICSNLLNVIKEPKVRMAALEEIAALTDPEGSVFFTVYEGNKTSRGRRTGPDQWQNNRPLKSYIREIRKVFQEGYYFAGGKALAVSGRRKKRRRKRKAA
jgi:hypothetical protein